MLDKNDYYAKMQNLASQHHWTLPNEVLADFYGCISNARPEEFSHAYTEALCAQGFYKTSDFIGSLREAVVARVRRENIDQNSQAVRDFDYTPDPEGLAKLSRLVTRIKRHGGYSSKQEVSEAWRSPLTDEDRIRAGGKSLQDLIGAFAGVGAAAEVEWHDA